MGLAGSALILAAATILSTSVDVDATSVTWYPSATSRTIVLSFVRDPARDRMPFALDARLVSLELTDHRGRRRSIAIAESPKMTSHVSTSHAGFESVDFFGDDVANLTVPLPSDLPEDLYTLRLAGPVRFADAAGMTLAVEGGGYEAFIPPSTDRDLDELRERYVGHEVYGVGRELSGECPGVGSASFQRNRPVEVIGVRRLRSDAVILGMSSSGRGDFLSLEPIEVTFRTPPGAAVGGSAMSPPDEKLQPGQISPRVTEFLEAPAKRCPITTTRVAGRWQFERMMSRRNPIDPSWPKRFRIAAEERKPRKGMTYAMVLATMGYPPIFGSVAELSRLSEWRYDTFDAIVFTNGRVSKLEFVNQP